MTLITTFGQLLRVVFVLAIFVNGASAQVTDSAEQADNNPAASTDAGGATAIPGAAELEAGDYAGAIEKTRQALACLLYTSPSPRDLSTSRMPSSA